VIRWLLTPLRALDDLIGWLLWDDWDDEDDE
jgi:hypothetical protein